MQDGSGESFQELLKAITSPTSLFEFDTNVFQAALTGKLVIIEVAVAAGAPPWSTIQWHRIPFHDKHVRLPLVLW